MAWAMLIGYARVSTLERNLDLQEDALKAAGGKKFYTDKTGGTKVERPGLEKALADVRPGDSLVVWKLDRLGRSLKHLIETVTDLSHRGVGFRSLQEAIDTTTSGGKLIFHVFGASPSSSGTSFGSGPSPASPPLEPAGGKAAGPATSTTRRSGTP